MNLTTYSHPTPLQRRIETVVTNGTLYNDSHIPMARKDSVIDLQLALADMELRSGAQFTGAAGFGEYVAFLNTVSKVREQLSGAGAAPTEIKDAKVFGMLVDVMQADCDRHPLINSIVDKYGSHNIKNISKLPGNLIFDEPKFPLYNKLTPGYEIPLFTEGLRDLPSVPIEASGLHRYRDDLIFRKEDIIPTSYPSSNFKDEDPYRLPRQRVVSLDPLLADWVAQILGPKHGDFKTYIRHVSEIDNKKDKK